jgi:hypothetical protein
MCRAMKTWPWLSLMLATGCASTILQGETSARLEGARGMLAQMVVATNATGSDRSVIHLSNPCSLKIDGASYPVADMLELVKGAPGRLNSSILVFSPSRALLHKIAYTTERPLSCLENRLYVAGDLSINGGAGGNELSFGPGGAQISQRHVDEAPGILK